MYQMLSEQWSVCGPYKGPVNQTSVWAHSVVTGLTAGPKFQCMKTDETGYL